MGGGVVSRTVLVIGYMQDDDHFHVVFMERYHAQEDPNEILEAIVRRCTEFRTGLIAADGAGNGSVYNNLLLNMIPQVRGLYAMIYSVSDQQPRQYKGRLWNWTIGRTPSIGMVFTRIKKQPFISRGWPIAVHSSARCGAKRQNTMTIIAPSHTRIRKPSRMTPYAVNYAATLARQALNVRLAYGRASDNDYGQ